MLLVSAELIVLYWGHRYHRTFVSVCETIEEAAHEAWIDSQYGEASFECVEVIENGESRIESISAFWDRWDAEQIAEEKAASERPIVSTTQIRSPEIGGQHVWVDLDWYRDAADAARHALHVAKFGERVRFTIK